MQEDAARRTVVLIAFFPAAVFFSAAYTESLFLALSVGVLLAARRERWALAGALGALAAATRSMGVLLIVPALLMYLSQPVPPNGRPVSMPSAPPLAPTAVRAT